MNLLYRGPAHTQWEADRKISYHVRGKGINFYEPVGGWGHKARLGGGVKTGDPLPLPLPGRPISGGGAAPDVGKFVVTINVTCDSLGASTDISGTTEEN